MSINPRNLGCIVPLNTWSSAIQTTAVSLDPTKMLNALFLWMSSEQVFPLRREWSELELEGRLRPACSAEIIGPADTL